MDPNSCQVSKAMNETLCQIVVRVAFSSKNIKRFVFQKTSKCLCSREELHILFPFLDNPVKEAVIQRPDDFHGSTVGKMSFGIFGRAFDAKHVDFESTDSQ